MNDAGFDTATLSRALRPGGAIAAGYDRVWDTIWHRQTHVPTTLLELCRLRLARLHGATAEMALRHDLGIDAGKIDALLAGSHVDDPRFSAAERAALEFTEVYAQDPMAIDDELAAAVTRHLGEAGLVCLVESLGFIEGRIRLALMFSTLHANATH